jgi:hypothetical protein
MPHGVSPQSAAGDEARAAEAAETYQEIQFQLRLAIAAEEYAQAAVLKKQLDALAAPPASDEDLRHELTQAIAEERYEVRATSMGGGSVARCAAHSVSGGAGGHPSLRRPACRRLHAFEMSWRSGRRRGDPSRQTALSLRSSPPRVTPSPTASE